MKELPPMEFSVNDIGHYEAGSSLSGAIRPAGHDLGWRRGRRVGAVAFARNQRRVQLAKATRKDITGSSPGTPATVAKTAPEFKPNWLIATATSSSPTAGATYRNRFGKPYIERHYLP